MRVLDVPLDKEILIVDDASEQATKQLIRAVVKNKGNVKLFTHLKNEGKGASIRTALEHARGDVVIIQDADLEYYPEDYPNLLRIYQDNKTMAVYGVRDLSRRSLAMRFGNQFLTWTTNLLFGARLKDMETCYKLIDRRLLKSLALNSNGFEIEAEITAKLLLANVRIMEVPIRYMFRKEGKKLTPLDGIPTLITLFKHRFRRGYRREALTEIMNDR
jgi:glycosyltransferase involved in cell wall biosynthesis